MRARHRLKDNIKTNDKGTLWIHTALDKVRSRTVMSTVMNIKREETLHLISDYQLLKKDWLLHTVS
jgi:hypothetical protein